MNMGMFILFPIILLGGGGGGASELLDYVQTQAYWKTRSIEPDVKMLIAMIDAVPKADDISALIKQLGNDDFAKREAASKAIAGKGPGVIPQLKEALKSPDAEVVDRATRLIDQLSGSTMDPAVHKLMIVRTLGEMKDAAALPALKALVDAKEPFLADYAKRSIAQIEGKTFSMTVTPQAVYEKDLWMLPKGVKLVTQMTMESSGPVNWVKALESFQVPLPNVNKDEALGQIQMNIEAALNSVGNVRIDGITLGVSGDPGPQSGYMVVYVRGYYDREKAVQAFTKLGLTVGEQEGITTVTPERGMMMLMPSNDLFVILGGPPQGTWPVKEVAAAVKAGKGTLAEDAGMVKLIESANRKTGGWAVVEMTPTYRSGDAMFQPYDTVIAHRTMDKKKTTIQVQATGKDAAAIAQSVTKMNAGLEEVRVNMKQAAGFVPQQIMDFVDSLKIESAGEKATLTGSMEGGFEQMLGAMMFPMMMMGGPGGL